MHSFPTFAFMVDPPIFDELVLKETYFDHPSMIHGVGHTYRVMVLVHELCLLTCNDDLLLPGVAAAYIHDMARKHDGYCDRHGQWAVEEKIPLFRQFFLDNHFHPRELDGIAAAIENHCVQEELVPDHPHYLLTALLKDADALDRIRLGPGNLRPDYLRFSQSRGMVGFAEALFFMTRNLKFNNFTGILQYARSINQNDQL